MSDLLLPCADTGRLWSARDDTSLALACHALVDGSPHVGLHVGRLVALQDRVRLARPVAWEWMFDPRSVTDADRLFDAAFNASLNGGYFHRDGEGRVRQWEERGSGSQALGTWIDGLRRGGVLPGHDVSGTGGAIEAWLEAVRPGMQGQPYQEERLAVLRQFADPARRAQLNGLACEVLADGGMAATLPLVDRLADIYPAGLRADPLRKKAMLAFLLVAGHRAAAGLPVTWRVGAPMDYQLPRILLWQGVLQVSAQLDGLLRQPDVLLPIDSTAVFHLRAASFVAIEILSAMTGVPSFLVDGALFMDFRRDPEFVAEAPPPMRVDGTWF